MKFSEFYNEVVNLALLDGVDESDVEKCLVQIRAMWRKDLYTPSDVYEIIFSAI